MLLTGFDSKYLNTLYVDKGLKYHGLIQAFSRTNRVLNYSKPYGNILDFRGQQDAVDEAIALFSGVRAEKARQIWLVDRAPVVIDRLKSAVEELGDFMKSQGLSGKPEDVANLKGNEARAAFIKRFKEVQRLQTQLDQYTDLTIAEEEEIEAILPKDELHAFRGVYLETAQKLKELQNKPGDKKSELVDQLDFEFVLFASATIDYDYIMRLVTEFQARPAGKVTMSRDELVGLIAADSKFLEEREDITQYIMGLKPDGGLDEGAIRAGYEAFKEKKSERELAELAGKHGLSAVSLQAFVDGILGRKIFDGEALTELLAPLDLGWKERAHKEQSLMADLIPILKKRSGGRDISGLRAYEE
jgi:type I restriction enzyme R subunit